MQLRQVAALPARGDESRTVTSAKNPVKTAIAVLSIECAPFI